MCGAEGGENPCSCSSTVVPRPRQLPRFQLRQQPQQSTCTCRSSQNRQQFNPIGDRCTCGDSAVTPAVRPQCTCQVGQDDTNLTPNLNPSSPNGERRGRGRGMLGLFGLRGILGQLGRPVGAPALGGVALNSRIFLRPQNNANSIVRQTNVEEETDDNSIIT